MLKFKIFFKKFKGKKKSRADTWYIINTVIVQLTKIN